MKPFGRCRSSYLRSAILSQARLGPLGQRKTLGVPTDARVGPALTGRRRGRGLQWDSSDSRFTVEEYKVVCLVTVGYTDREIGRKLFMSEWTVRYHLRKVFARFAIRRRLQLVLLLTNDSLAGGGAVGDPPISSPSLSG